MKQTTLTMYLGAILIALAFITGCSGLLIHQAIDRGQTLTPEQIESYKQQNMDVWGCFQIAGPPPAGASTWIVAPKGSAGVSFMDGCRLK